MEYYYLEYIINFQIKQLKKINESDQKNGFH